MYTKFFFTLLASAFLISCADDNSKKEINEKEHASSQFNQNEEEEALYLKRFNSRTTELAIYDILAPIKGTDNYKTLERSSQDTISSKALEAAFDYVKDKNTSAFMVWRNDGIETKKFFEDFDNNSLIVSKSLAKPISVIAVGRAIKEGHIKSLDQPVADFISEWRGTDKDKILVRHLLDMRSGLLPQGQALEPENVLNRAYMHPRHDEIIINEYPLVHTPGTRYDYANATSELVAPLIELATGVQYEDWISNEILKPLGAQGGEIWMNRKDGTPHSGCCNLLPAETYLRLAILYLKDGTWDGQRLLPEGYVDQVKTATPQNPHTGMGVYVAGPYVKKRGPLNPDLPFGQTLHSSPYLAEDLYLFDGLSPPLIWLSYVREARCQKM